MGAAVVASRYGMVKNLKEDSAAYLKSWLDSIKEKPDFLKSVIMDVKRSTNIMTQRIDKIQLAIDEGRQIDRAQFIANDYKPESQAERNMEPLPYSHRDYENILQGLLTIYRYMLGYDYVP